MTAATPTMSPQEVQEWMARVREGRIHEYFHHGEDIPEQQCQQCGVTFWRQKLQPFCSSHCAGQSASALRVPEVAAYIRDYFIATGRIPRIRSISEHFQVTYSSAWNFVRVRHTAELAEELRRLGVAL